MAVRKSQAKPKAQVTEDDVLKALGNLEDDAAAVEEPEVEDDGGEEEPEEEAPRRTRKSVAPLPASTKAANGGFSGPGGTGERGDVDVNAEESEDGTGIGKGKKAKKSMRKAAPVTEDDEIEDDNDPEEPEDDDVPQTTRKSARSAFRSNDTIRKGVEVSPFLESLTDVFGDEIDKLSKSLDEAFSDQADFNSRLQKAVIMIGKTVVNIAKSVEAFGNAPARPRKSTLTKSEVVGGPLGDDGPQFSKAQVLDVMTSLVMKGQIPALAVPTYETTDYIAPEHVVVVENALRGLN